MSNLDNRLLRLAGSIPKNYYAEKVPRNPGYWGERIISQLIFAHEMSKAADNRYDPEVDLALTRLERGLEEDGAITKRLAQETEALLAALQEPAKAYRILCVAHAHIDMNWKWPWQETVSVTLDTFQTMLNLLDEYPEFRFSQSQGAIYRIVEQYDPHMLSQIKRRVAEGRWEVTASHWVEADKNMSGGESLVRQVLYSKKYLSALFDLAPDEMPLDFEPDTFGHSLQVPEILASAGVNYYYHCRGSEGPLLYRWEGPSGQSVIAYREPTWYNDYVQAMLGAYVPDICRRTGLSTHLYVYGVGDHGGGPTRRDLERLLDMRLWPIYPVVEFGTYGQFFALAERISDQLPIVRGEQNFVFTGCYTSQSRIKRANREAENALYEAEAFRAVAAVSAKLEYPARSFEQAWRNVLFNQFHDILPGSGIQETREHALGTFQETMAIAGASTKKALAALTAVIDTAGLAETDLDSIAEGAGAGFGAKRTGVSQIERGCGPTRIVHVFNPSPEEREEVVEWVVWDWKSPMRSFTIKEAGGAAVPNQVVDQGFHHYWGHDYLRIFFRARVPALGYNTYTLMEAEYRYSAVVPDDLRLEKSKSYVLENERIRAEFDPLTAKVVSLLHKSTGEELVDPARPAGLFRLIRENADEEMTSWLVGEYMQVEDPHLSSKWLPADKGELRQTLRYELSFGSSSLVATVTLDVDSSELVYDVECVWQEIGRKGVNIPQLGFSWPVAYASSEYQCDVPFGTIVRRPLPHDVPASSWMLAQRDRPELPAIQLVTDAKHGFRGMEDCLNVALLRSSIDPDPYPEFGSHRFRMAVIVTEASENHKRVRQGKRFAHPLAVVSGIARKGTAAPQATGMELLAGTVVCSALKMPEDANPSANAWIVRLYETDGELTEVMLKLSRPVQAASFVDALEREVEVEQAIQLQQECIRFKMKPYASTAIRIAF